MRLCEHELKAREILTKAGVDSPGLCARILTARAAGLAKIDYILCADQELDTAAAGRLEKFVARRAKGEPLAYILGEKEFYGLLFRVSAATLTPRPETELLVELALKFLPEQAIDFVDLGCGSGCIGETLLCLRPLWRGVLLDASWGALRIAQANARSLGCAAGLLQADLFDLPIKAASMDLIISNPPYISPEDKRLVMAETLAYEPHSALFSSSGGMAHIEGVIAGAANCLKNGGYVMLEHGATQAPKVAGLLLEYGFVQIETFKDLAGLPRCAVGRK